MNSHLSFPASAVVNPLAGCNLIEAYNQSTHQWEPAHIQRFAPYRGTAGWYVSWPNAKEEWESHSAWVFQARRAKELVTVLEPAPIGWQSV